MADNSNAPELEPCPCCGGVVDWYEVGRYSGISTRCEDCRMIFMGYWSDSPNSYAKKFNTRPAITPQQAAKASPIYDLLPDAVARAEKAMRKFPQPNYTISKWAEESGEVTKALIHAAEDRETWENIRGELVDTLAMLHRLFIEGDEVHGLKPLRAIAEQEVKTDG